MLFCNRVSATTDANWNAPNAIATPTIPAGCPVSAPAVIATTAPTSTPASHRVDNRATRPANRPPVAAPAQISNPNSGTRAALTPVLWISSGVYSSSALHTAHTSATRITADRTGRDRRVSASPARTVADQPGCAPSSSLAASGPGVRCSGNAAATAAARTHATALAAPTAW